MIEIKDKLKRGFKAEAERLAKDFRTKINIHPCAPLCAFKLADFLKIQIFSATDFLTDITQIKLLSESDGSECGWSALTMITKSNTQIIIHNPFHSKLRQQSNIMHELAHVICKHEHIQKVYDFEIPFGMREYDENYEEEAKILGATLQLPTPSLLWAIKKSMTIEEISSYFNASVEMVNFRLNTTGIKKRNFKTK